MKNSSSLLLDLLDRVYYPLDHHRDDDPRTDGISEL
jgi:hypothetical protein